ncbi:uncharacterized protein WM294_013489 [Sarcoramphus papa]
MATASGLARLSCSRCAGELLPWLGAHGSSQLPWGRLGAPDGTRLLPLPRLPLGTPLMGAGRIPPCSQCCLGSSSSPGPWLLWGQPASTTISILIFISIFILIFIFVLIFILLLPPVLPPSTRRRWGCAGSSRRILPSLAHASRVLLLSPRPLMSP